LLWAEATILAMATLAGAAHATVLGLEPPARSAVATIRCGGDRGVTFDEDRFQIRSGVSR
jgi:hypothetical protein